MRERESECAAQREGGRERERLIKFGNFMSKLG